MLRFLKEGVDTCVTTILDGLVLARWTTRRIPVWAGVLAMKLLPQESIADERVTAQLPAYIRDYPRPRAL